MSRIRTIKPEFFRHEKLFEAETATRLPLRVAFAGLWTVADRQGRFRWRPRVIKLDVLPFDEVDFDAVLAALVTYGFIVKYSVGADIFGCIPSFSEHQHVNQRESASDIPAPDEDGARTCETMPARGEGKGREQEGEEEGNGTTQQDAHAREGSAPSPSLRVAEALRAEFGDWAEANPDVSPILALVDKGYDLDKDILPVIRARAPKAQSVGSWRYFVPAIEQAKAANGVIKPKAVGTPSEPVAWLPADSPRWGEMNKRSMAEKRRPLLAMGSMEASGVGAFVPKAWLVERSAA